MISFSPPGHVRDVRYVEPRIALEGSRGVEPL
jgi:hypothetical protein